MSAADSMDSATALPTYERLGSIALGALAMAFGLRRRSLFGFAVAALGAPMVARGVLGRSLVPRDLVTGGVEAHASITIRRPRGEVYRMWRDFRNLPRFMSHLKEVSVEDERLSHWVVEEGPLVLEWMAQVVDDLTDRRIAWQALPGSDLENEGLVEFRDARGGRGTEIEVTIRYRPPGGILAASALRGLLRRFTSVQLRVELLRLRQLLETGEIATGAHKVARKLEKRPSSKRAAKDAPRAPRIAHDNPAEAAVRVRSTPRGEA